MATKERDGRVGRGKNYCEVDSERCGERANGRTKAECRDVKQRPLEPTIAVFVSVGSTACLIPGVAGNR